MVLRFVQKSGPNPLELSCFVVYPTIYNGFGASFQWSAGSLPTKNPYSTIRRANGIPCYSLVSDPHDLSDHVNYLPKRYVIEISIAKKLGLNHFRGISYKNGEKNAPISAGFGYSLFFHSLGNLWCRSKWRMPTSSHNATQVSFTGNRWTPWCFLLNRCAWSWKIFLENRYKKIEAMGGLWSNQMTSSHARKAENEQTSWWWLGIHLLREYRPITSLGQWICRVERVRTPWVFAQGDLAFNVKESEKVLVC